MKYLKIFDSLEFDESSRDKYWDDYLKKLNSDIKKSKKESETNYDEYYKLVSNLNNEVDKLFNMLISFDVNELDKVQNLFTDKYSTNVMIRQHPIKKLDCRFIRGMANDGSIIKVYKLEDEWYLVSISDYIERGKIYDKCDQFEGLEKLLNRILTK